VSDPCCAPNRGGGTPAAAAGRAPPSGGTGAHDASLVTIPTGIYRMGDETDWAYPDDGEAPVHPVELPSFRIDRHAVTEAFHPGWNVMLPGEGTLVLCSY